METVLAVIAVVVVVVIFVAVSRYLHKKRVAELTEWARANGWRYHEHGGDVYRRFVGHPFGNGFGRKALHLLTTTLNGREVTAFEYSYKERRGSGKDRRTVTYTFQVTAAKTPAPRPMLQVSQENFGTKLIGAVGMKDLQLESEQFNQEFRIKTDNDKFAYDVLHPQTMEWMMADPRARELPFRFEQAEIVTWQRGKLNPRQAAWAAGYLAEHVDRVPPFVWQ